MTYPEEEYLMISGLQHYYFCKRQWALIHIFQVWDDNALTTAGNILHQKADDPFIVETRNDTIISRGMAVSSASLGFSGILDVVEFKQNKHGIAINNHKGLWLPNIVEYKHGKPKKNKCDLMQLTAQVICLEEMLQCRITSADLFYATPNRRTTVIIDESLREEARNLAMELHEMFKAKKLTKAESYKNCTKCSLYEICIPRLTKKQHSVINYITKNLEDGDA